MQPAPPFPVEGPFASEFVLEDLAELRAREIAALGKVTVPRGIHPSNPGLGEILGKEQKRREKALASTFSWQKPYFDGPFDQRRLRLLAALYRPPS